MIEYDEEGRYLRHIALSEYRRIKRNERELRRLLRQGQTLQKALTIVFGCPLSAFVPGFFDLAEWFLLRDD